MAIYWSHIQSISIETVIRFQGTLIIGIITLIRMGFDVDHCNKIRKSQTPWLGFKDPT